jgi:hypothetical protein
MSCIIPIMSNVCPGFSSLQSQPTHCRPTYIDPMRCIMPSHQQESSPSCHMGPIHALFFCIIRIISLLYPAWTGRSLVHRLHRRGLGTQVVRRHRHTSRGLRAGGDVVWQRCCGDIAMIKVSSGPARPGPVRSGPARPGPARAPSGGGGPVVLAPACRRRRRRWWDGKRRRRRGPVRSGPPAEGDVRRSSAPSGAAGRQATAARPWAAGPAASCTRPPARPLRALRRRGGRGWKYI